MGNLSGATCQGLEGPEVKVSGAMDVTFNLYRVGYIPVTHKSHTHTDTLVYTGKQEAVSQGPIPAKQKQSKRM